MTVKAQELGKFEGKTEVASELQITKTGDGLSKPLSAEPRGWKAGTRIPVLLWVEVDKIRHDRVEKGDGHVRVHIAPTIEAAVLDRVDQKVLDDLMAEQREAVRLWELEQKRLSDEAKGALALDGLEKGGPVDGGAAVGEHDAEAEVEYDGRPEGISDADWEASARGASVSPIGSKVAKKAEAKV
jgi:hypothetical protein